VARQTPIGIARLFQFLLERVRERFSGHVTISFREGSIVTVRREETWIEEQQLPVKDEQAIQIMEHGQPLEHVA
jgi:hypothetical protein